MEVLSLKHIKTEDTLRGRLCQRKNPSHRIKLVDDFRDNHPFPMSLCNQSLAKLAFHEHCVVRQLLSSFRLPLSLSYSWLEKSESTLRVGM